MYCVVAVANEPGIYPERDPAHLQADPGDTFFCFLANRSSAEYPLFSSWLLVVFFKPPWTEVIDEAASCSPSVGETAKLTCLRSGDACFWCVVNNWRST